MSTLFLLSPAHAGGRRARFLLNPAASFALARRLHGGEGVSLGEIFSFLSGLYFRGKLAYASRFGTTALVITPHRGLVGVERPMTLAEMSEFGAVDIDPADPRYRAPLEQAVAELAAALPPAGRVILLGSLATAKYVEVLRGPLGGRLHYPVAFLGRGDMSRGALLLRAAAAGVELEYAPIEHLPGKTRRAPSPAAEKKKLAAPRRKSAAKPKGKAKPNAARKRRR